MTDPESATPLSPARWGTILGVLSLDLAQSYVEAMGLRLPPGPEFLSRLREHIGTFRRLQADNPAEDLPFAQTFFEEASRHWGPAFAEHLRRWGEEVFQYSSSDGVGVFLWNNIVRRGGLDGARDTHPPPGVVREMRRRLAERGPPAPGPAMPASEWDKALYARHGYDKTFNPMDMVGNTVSYCTFVRAWEEVMRDPRFRGELGALREWGTAEARRMGMPLDRVGEPGSWSALPPVWVEAPGG